VELPPRGSPAAPRHAEGPALDTELMGRRIGLVTAKQQTMRRGLRGQRVPQVVVKDRDLVGVPRLECLGGRFQRRPLLPVRGYLAFPALSGCAINASQTWR